jgi:8-oxo-dGTP pyrophosphatase MutT (NUDIX family)
MMSNKTMYCNNCGEGGHVFRSCKEPITSYGLLLLRGQFEPLNLPADPNKLSVVMVKRKDSMTYMEFIRGKYEPLNLLYVSKLIRNMTKQEQELIINEPFDKLWTRLWGMGRDTKSLEYEDSLNKYNSLDRKKIVNENRTIFTEPEWGFPKGRRSKGETDLECGIREFYEETNIPETSYEIVKDFSLTETFIATNEVTYRHTYFIALLKSSRQFDLSERLTSMQRREVSAVEWKTLKDCKNITRPHYEERKKLIERLEKQVKIYKPKL